MTNANDWAYPFQANETNNQPDGGLTKREYFAAMAMQGLLANSNELDKIAIRAVQASDALITELNKQP